MDDSKKSILVSSFGVSEDKKESLSLFIDKLIESSNIEISKKNKGQVRGEVLSEVDKIFTDAGFEKKGQKTFDFVKSVMLGIKEIQKKAEISIKDKTDFETKFSDLQEEASEKLATQKTDFESQLKEKDTSFNKTLISNKLLSFSSRMKHSEEINNLVIQGIDTDKFIFDKSGNLRVVNENNEIITDELLKPVSPFDYLRENNKTFADSLKVENPDNLDYNYGDKNTGTGQNIKGNTTNEFTEKVEQFVAQGMSRDEAYVQANK